MVDFLFPVDDDNNATNGRIYLRDSFVFDAAEQNFKKFERSYQYNGKGQGAWKDWLKKLQGAALPSSEEARVFALTVGRSYSRPLDSDDPNIKQALVSQKAYLTKAADLVRAQNSDWKLLSSDPQNRYHLTFGKFGWELTTYLMLRRSKEPSHAILLREKIFLDTDNKTVKSQERSWEAAAGANETALQALLSKLNQQPLPSKSEAQTYVTALLPALRPIIPAPLAVSVNPPSVPAVPSQAKDKPAGSLVFSFTGNAKNDRDDTVAIYAEKTKPLVKTRFTPHLKNEKIQKLKFEMVANVNPATGSIDRINFNILEFTGTQSAEWLKGQLEILAGEVFRNFRFNTSVDGAIKSTFNLKAI